VRAIVLVGGEGTRLRPLTLTTPKPLLPVAEVAMIERVLHHLAGHGVEEAVLSMGYRPDAFAVAFPEDRAAGVRLRYAVEPEPLDTAGAIRFAAEEAGLDQAFLVVNGDVLTDMDVSALIAFHRASGALATVSLTPVEDPSAFGVVPTDADGRVSAFIEKPPRDAAPTNLINAGTYVLEPDVLDRVPAGRRVSVEREVFPGLAGEGLLYALASDAYWLDTGTPEAYLQANADLLAGRRRCQVAPGATERDPGVWIIGAPVIDGEVEAPCLVGEAAFVAAGARVVGSVVGGGARVGRGAIVRGSVVLPGAVVGPDAIVDRSIIGEAAAVHEGARVQAVSVIGGGAVVAPGSVLEGARVAA